MSETGKRPFPAPLLLILALFVLLSLLYNAAIPPFEGPDGPEHFAYVAWLAGGRGFPPQGAAAWETAVRQEAGQPPLYYLLAALPARLAGFNDPPAVYRPNPHFPSAAPGHIPDNKNIAIHYPADGRPLRGGWLAIYLARAISLLAGIGLILAVYALTRETVPERPRLALAAASLVALIPQVLFLSSVVSNDLPAAALGALVLWLLIRLLRRGPTARGGLALGTALGLAALTKVNALLLTVPVAAELGWLWLARRESRRTTAAAGIWTAVGGAAVAGWWFARAWRLYGSPLGLDSHCYAPWAYCDGAAVRSPVAEWLEVFQSTWAAFGWGNIKFPGPVYVALAVLLVAAVVGLVRVLARRPDRTTAVALALFALALLIAAAALELWMRQVAAPHGRLLFVALGGAAVLLVVGWDGLDRRLPWVGVAAMGLLSVAALLLLVRPAYARPQPLTASQLADLAGPASLGWRFGRFAELHNVVVGRLSVEAGEALPVRVCWRTLAPADRDYSLFLHLVGPEERVVAARRTYPGLGRYPTSSWTPGVRFCDEVRVDVPPDLARTLLYRIEVGLIDDATGKRLTAVGADGLPREHTFANAARLRSASTQFIEPPPGDGPIRLVDFSLPDGWTADQTAVFSLSWTAVAPPPADLTTFVHLRRPSDGQNAAVADGPPLDGWYPTSAWEAGELVVDERSFPLPPALPPGDYELVVGWYDPATGARIGGEWSLGAVEVAAP